MGLTITTTGTQGTIDLVDLGGRQLSHPVTIDLELEYTLDELITSTFLESALSAGEITIADGDGNNVTTLSNVRMLKSGYDSNNDNIVEESFKLGGQTGSYYLDAANLNGTLNPDVETGLSIYPLVVTGNELISGGATWLIGLTFSVTELQYSINGMIYTATASLVELDTPDPTNDRIDVLYADLDGNISKLTGVASPSPLKPIVNDDTQVEITFITVKPGGVDIQIDQIYDENNGGVTEWFGTGNGLVLNSTNGPLFGSTNIEATNATSSSYATFSATQSTVTDFSLIDFAIKSKGQWQSTDNVKFTFLLNGSTVGKTLKLLDGTLGFDSSNTSTYQTFSFKKNNFQIPNEITGLRLDVGSTNGIGFYMDNVRLQKGLSVISNESATIEDLEQGLIGAYALYYSTTNNTITTNPGISVPQKLLGTTTISEIQGFSTDGFSNYLRFLEPDTRTFEIEINMSVLSSQSNQTYEFYFYINGTTKLITSQKTVQFTSGGTAQSVVLGDFVTLEQDDYIEVWCQNDSSPTKTVTVISMNLRIKKIN